MKEETYLQKHYYWVYFHFKFSFHSTIKISKINNRQSFKFNKFQVQWNDRKGKVFLAEFFSFSTLFQHVIITKGIQSDTYLICTCVQIFTSPTGSFEIYRRAGTRIFLVTIQVCSSTWHVHDTIQAEWRKRKKRVLKTFADRRTACQMVKINVGKGGIEKRICSKVVKIILDVAKVDWSIHAFEMRERERKILRK